METTPESTRGRSSSRDHISLPAPQLVPAKTMLAKLGESLDRSEDENNEERTEEDLAREELINTVIKHSKYVCEL